MDRNLEFFLTSHIGFLFIFEQWGDNCKSNLFLKRKVGVTERPRSLNPSKAKTLALGARARWMTWHVNLRVQPCAVRMRRNNWRERPQGSSKGFFVAILFMKRWKITKKDVYWCGQTICLLATLLLGYTLRVLVTSYQLPWQRTRPLNFSFCKLSEKLIR